LKKPGKKAMILITAGVLLAVLAVVLFIIKPFGGASDSFVSVQKLSDITGMSAGGTDNYYAGVIETQETIKLQRDTNRTLKDTYVQTGDEVQVGQPLFEYDFTESELALERAKIEEQQLKNAISSYEKQLETLNKQLGQASSTEEKLDLTEQIQTMEATISQSEYDLKVKQLEVEDLEKNQEDTVITSPIDGVVKSVGSTNEFAEEGSAYIVLMSLGDYRVKCSINESNLGSVTEGDMVTVYSRVDESVYWTGTVSQIETETAAEDGATAYYDDFYSEEMLQSSNYCFYVQLDSEDGLLIGQHVYVRRGAPVKTGEEELSVPESFVVTEANGGTFVWAANSRGYLEKRKVTLGDYNADTMSYAVVSGLQADDYLAFPDDSFKGGEVVFYEEWYGGSAHSVEEDFSAEEELFDEELPEDAVAGDFAEEVLPE